MEELILKIPEQYPMTDDELFAFCAANKELRIERDENGQLIVMSPAGSFSSNINFILNGLFWSWVSAHPELGYGFESSGGFTLPDKSMRSADVAWIKKEKWDKLERKEKEKFAPICPDFVIELRSPSDSINQLKSKMTKWISNGCQLAWLIDPIEEQVFVYTATSSQQVNGFDNILKGDPLLPGFVLDLSRLK